MVLRRCYLQSDVEPHQRGWDDEIHQGAVALQGASEGDAVSAVGRTADEGPCRSIRAGFAGEDADRITRRHEGGKEYRLAWTAEGLSQCRSRATRSSRARASPASA